MGAPLTYSKCTSSNLMLLFSGLRIKSNAPGLSFNQKDRLSQIFVYLSEKKRIQKYRCETVLKINGQFQIKTFNLDELMEMTCSQIEVTKPAKRLALISCTCNCKSTEKVGQSCDAVKVGLRISSVELSVESGECTVVFLSVELIFRVYS